MQLIGQAIRHETFGKGVVTDCNTHTVTICFSSGEKKFIYPDAFDKFLTLKNTTMQDKVEGLLKKQEAEEEARLLAIQEKQDRKNHLRLMKVSPCSQGAFDVSAEEADDCFARWCVSTGSYLSGSSKGQPRIPDRLKANSMCLITTIPQGKTDHSRCILGAFMAREDFLGSACCSGEIPAHPDYRLRLKKPLPFWSYITEEPGKQRWGRTAFKYLHNTTGETILFDMISQMDSEEARAFYQYYCIVNHLEPRRLPQ